MVVLQVYRIAQYELGPRRFWWWWCGGLKVYDAVAVALWFALNILCVQQRVCLELPGLQGECHKGFCHEGTHIGIACPPTSRTS